MTRSAARGGPLGPAEAAELLAPFLPAQAGPTILAVSGGPDSVALMRLAARQTGRLLVATIDHGLRPESEGEADAVAGWAASLDLPHRIPAWIGPKPRTRIQERARAARYRLLTDLAREVGAGSVLTAHTLDDQAETILMRLCAGSGIGGLAGMEPRRDLGGITLGRPFLDVPKRRLVATCAAEGWPTFDDPSNRDRRFGRVRARSLLAALGPEGLSAERLASLGRRAARAEAAIEGAAEAAFRRLASPDGPRRIVLAADALRREPEEIAVRVLARAVRDVGRSSVLRLDRLERLADRVREAESGMFRETFGGALLDLGADGRLTVSVEPPRRRGRPQP